MKRVLAVFGIFVLAVLLFAPAAFAEETPCVDGAVRSRG